MADVDLTQLFADLSAALNAVQVSRKDADRTKADYDRVTAEEEERRTESVAAAQTARDRAIERARTRCEEAMVAAAEKYESATAAARQKAATAADANQEAVERARILQQKFRDLTEGLLNPSQSGRVRVS